MSFFITQQSYADTYPSTQCQAEFLSANIPCMTYKENQYSITLNSVSDSKWALIPNYTPSYCKWNKETCVTINDDLELKIPPINLQVKVCNLDPNMLTNLKVI